MNQTLLSLQRPFIWLRRFRHRCGYGVHSPFAFNLITNVIYESTPYYKYKELAAQAKLLKSSAEKHRIHESAAQNRLLFRLVNYAMPHRIVDAGVPSASALYLKAARVGAEYTHVSSSAPLANEREAADTFYYLHDYLDPEFVGHVFQTCASHATEQSVCVVHGIHYTPAMRNLWRAMQQHPRVRVTFDLYDIGILFFDSSKQKQHYLVNFCN